MTTTSENFHSNQRSEGAPVVEESSVVSSGMEAATGEAAVAEIRHEIMLCHPDGTAPEVIDAQFRDFRFERSAEPPKAGEVCG